MTEVLVVIHLILAISIVVLVLLQRSEGGALGIGGSGNLGGLVSGRAAGSFLTKATAGMAAGFMLTSMLLTIVAGNTGERRSIADEIEGGRANQEAPISGPQVPKSE